MADRLRATVLTWDLPKAKQDKKLLNYADVILYKYA